MPCISSMLRLPSMQRMLAAGCLGLSAMVASAQSGQGTQGPPAAATEPGMAIVPTAPPGIYITPPTEFRPPVRRESDGTPPVEGCPAGDNRKLELLV
jgi:hypothetical protein